MNLYKYKAYNEYSIKELKEKEIWFSHPTGFNDPLDSFTPVKIMVDKILDRLDEIKFDKELDFNNLIKSVILGNYGILSLTDNCKNSLMWAHYTDSHKGFVCEFEFGEKKRNSRNNEYIELLNNVKTGAVKVTYDGENRVRQLPDTKDILENPEKIIDEGLYKKTKEWEYENEYRLIFHSNVNDFIKYLESLRKKDSNQFISDNTIEKLKKVIEFKINKDDIINNKNNLIDLVSKMRDHFLTNVIHGLSPIPTPTINNVVDLINQCEKSIKNLKEANIARNEEYFNIVDKEIQELGNSLGKINTAKSRYEEVLNDYWWLYNQYIKFFDDFIGALTKGATVKYENQKLFNLKSIIFGMNMSPKQRLEIIEIVKNSEYKNKIKFKEVILKKDSLDLDVIEYKFDNISGVQG